jgi:hypothetical protein
LHYIAVFGAVNVDSKLKNRFQGPGASFQYLSGVFKRKSSVVNQAIMDRKYHKRKEKKRKGKEK